MCVLEGLVRNGLMRGAFEFRFLSAFDCDTFDFLHDKYPCNMEM